MNLKIVKEAFLEKMANLGLDGEYVLLKVGGLQGLILTDPNINPLEMLGCLLKQANEGDTTEGQSIGMKTMVGASVGSLAAGVTKRFAKASPVLGGVANAADSLGHVIDNNSRVSNDTTMGMTRGFQ